MTQVRGEALDHLLGLLEIGCAQVDDEIGPLPQEFRSRERPDVGNAPGGRDRFRCGRGGRSHGAHQSEHSLGDQGVGVVGGGFGFVSVVTRAKPQHPVLDTSVPVRFLEGRENPEPHVRSEFARGPREGGGLSEHDRIREDAFRFRLACQRRPRQQGRSGEKGRECSAARLPVVVREPCAPTSGPASHQAPPYRSARQVRSSD